MPSANAPEAPAQRPLTRSDYKTLSLSALGGALEFYDFIIFVFFATVVGKLFFPADMPEWLRQLQTFGLFAAGYLARPLGGVIMAHFGDLLGRKRMFTLSIFMMAVPTLIMGLLPTYAQIGIWAPLALLLLRVIRGAAIGGEVPGAWVFVAEHVPARHVGYACGTLTSGLTAGILLGSLVATAINSFYSATEVQDYAWRIPFLLGGVFGLFSVYLRRWLHETPVFAELQQRKALAEEVPLKAVVRDHRGAVLVSMLLTWVLSAAIVVVILMTPTVLQSVYGFDAATALKANSLAIVCLTLGCIVAGRMADRYGAGLTFVAGSVLLALVSGLLRQPQGPPGLALSFICTDRLLRRHRRRRSLRDGQCVPTGCAFLRPVLFLQPGLRHLRWADADGGGPAAQAEPDGAGLLRGHSVPGRLPRRALPAGAEKAGWRGGFGGLKALPAVI